MGVGLFGISIAKNSNAKKVTLCDISYEALEIAKKNIEANNSSDKCEVIQSDIFSNIMDKKFDMLVSNPPYIKSLDIATLDESVKKEPLIALDGGADGLNIYRRLLDGAKHILNDNSPILFEIGFRQKADLIQLISNYTCYEYIECIKDLERRDRVLVCRFHQI